MEPTKEQQELWIKAAGENPGYISNDLKSKIFEAGKFIAGYRGAEICKALSGIDFKSEVTKTDLPIFHYFIRWGDKGPWFTDTGWRKFPEAVGLMPNLGRPKVYYTEDSDVRALKCRAKSINVNWHFDPNKLDEAALRRIRERWAELRKQVRSVGFTLPDECPDHEKIRRYVGGERVQGGGLQYFVQDPGKMLELNPLRF